MFQVYVFDNIIGCQESKKVKSQKQPKITFIQVTKIVNGEVKISHRLLYFKKVSKIEPVLASRKIDINGFADLKQNQLTSFLLFYDHL